MLTQLSACAMRVGGTRIDKNSNLYGVITDSKTGKGIEGVPVTDGYKFTVTDKNGVYQMVADSLCRTVYYTIPAGYKVALAQDSKLPLFYSTAGIDLNKKIGTILLWSRWQAKKRILLSWQWATRSARPIMTWRDSATRLCLI